MMLSWNCSPNETNKLNGPVSVPQYKATCNQTNVKFLPTFPFRTQSQRFPLEFRWIQDQVPGQSWALCHLAAYSRGQVIGLSTIFFFFSFMYNRRMTDEAAVSYLKPWWQVYLPLLLLLELGKMIQQASQCLMLPVGFRANTPQSNLF